MSLKITISSFKVKDTSLTYKERYTEKVDCHIIQGISCAHINIKLVTVRMVPLRVRQSRYLRDALYSEVACTYVTKELTRIFERPNVNVRARFKRRSRWSVPLPELLRTLDWLRCSRHIRRARTQKHRKCHANVHEICMQEITVTV